MTAALAFEFLREPWTAGTVFWLAIGAAGAYFTLALSLNRAKILVDETMLVVRHGPIFWRGRALEKREVVAVMVRAFLGPDQEAGGFGLYAITANGEVPLLDGMTGSFHYQRLQDAGRRLAQALGVPLR